LLILKTVAYQFGEIGKCANLSNSQFTAIKKNIGLPFHHRLPRSSFSLDRFSPEADFTNKIIKIGPPRYAIKPIKIWCK
jgi:hypothetical protein